MEDRLDREFVVNTMLCKVKEEYDHEFRYVFELISPSRCVYTLQAEAEEEFTAWTNVLREKYIKANTKLFSAAQNDDLYGILEAICYGANPDEKQAGYVNRTALHEAAANCYADAVELLLQNGGNHALLDEDDKTARELATENDEKDFADVIS